MSNSKAVSPVPDRVDGAQRGPATPAVSSACRDDAMMCERCGASEMYRMHAVWRCQACGFKTDCCGW